MKEAKPPVKEKIYDEQIFPLVCQVISICREHKIAILFDANLGYDPQAGSDMKCTTALLSDDYHASSEMVAAFKILMGRSL